MKRLVHTAPHHACPQCRNPLRSQSSTPLYERVFYCTCGVTVVALDSQRPSRPTVLGKLLAMLLPRASNALRNARSSQS